MSGDSHPQQELGAYVLGALDVAETTRVREHLAGCPSCRAEHDRLAAAGGLLATVPEQAWNDIAQPSETGLRRLIGEVRAERSRSRRRLLTSGLAAGAAAASVAVAAAFLVTNDPAADTVAVPPPIRTTAASWQLSGANPARGIQGQVDVVPVGWGSKLEIELDGVKEGEQCRLVVVDQQGRRWNAGSWTVSYHGAFYWSGGVAIAEDRIAALDVITTDGQRLLRLT